jgi:hypothetical protein
MRSDLNPDIHEPFYVGLRNDHSTAAQDSPAVIHEWAVVGPTCTSLHHKHG